MWSSNSRLLPSPYRRAGAAVQGSGPWRRWLALGLLALAGAGCVSQPSALLTPYVVSGKAVVQSAQGDQRLNFRWRQTQDEYQITVWGALGVGRLQLAGTQQSLLVTSGRDSVSGPARAMMVQHLGWSVPLEAMGSWLLGEPATSLPQGQIRTDDQGRITQLQQAGWQVEFSRFELLDGVWRPRRLDITAAQMTMGMVLSFPRPVMGR